MNNKTIKYITLGNSESGKSSIIKKYIDKTFDKSICNTMAMDFHTKIVTINNNNFLLNIWDLSGSERFRSIIEIYYRDCNVILLVFDLNDKQTFNNLNYWYDEIMKIYNINYQNKFDPYIFLIGNKNDLDKKITLNDINNFINGKNITKYIECSAKTGYNIDYIFENINKYIYNDYLVNNSIEELFDSDDIISNKKNKCGLCNII